MALSRLFAMILVALSLAAAPGPAAAEGTPTPPPSPGAGTPGLAELRRSLSDQDQAVAAAESEMITAADQASHALEAYSLAVQAQQRAAAEQAHRRHEVDLAEAELARQRSRLGAWARRAYSSGNGLAADPTLSALLGDSAADLAREQHLLGLLGRQSDRTVTGVSHAAALRRRAAQAADEAAAATQRAVLAAHRAKQARDDAVAAQRATLDRLRARLSDTRTAVEQAEEQARLLAQARAIAAAEGSGGTRRDNRVTGAVGGCAGGDMQLFANGEIPLEALCPLWGAPGHHLRADAAYAFDQLAAEFARHLGRPLCVTDSYRSYAEQVRLKQVKPGLAATPGTSNHGWGTAVDLCGGIQDFDSAEHRWMQANAPAFGWFHPSWARREGSLPEPWHWEFAG